MKGLQDNAVEPFVVELDAGAVRTITVDEFETLITMQPFSAAKVVLNRVVVGGVGKIPFVRLREVMEVVGTALTESVRGES